MHPHTPTRHGRCEKCFGLAVLTHCDYADEYWCDDCHTSQAERDWERLTEDFHDGGSTRFTSLLQQQAAARKLK